MAIAFDSQAAYFDASPSHSGSFFNTAGTIMVLGIFLGVSETISGTPTYAGVNFTAIGGTPIITGTGIRAYLYYISAPATGSNTFAYSWSANAGEALLVTYSGANAFEVSNSVTGNSASSNVLTLTKTPTHDRTLMVGFSQNGSGLASSAGAGTTQRTSTANNYAAYDNNAEITPATSTTLTMNSAGTSSFTGMGGFIYLHSDLTLTATTGTFAMTGRTATLSFGRKMIATAGTFTMTGVAVLLSVYRKWTPQAKNSSVFTNQTKD